MHNIQMVDLHGQYLKIKQEVDSAIQKVIDTTAFINGPQVAEFKSNLANYLGANHVIPCANGTDALQIALMALDLKPGDEIITPDFTFYATAEVVALLGLKLVLVDIDKDTFTIDIPKLKQAITDKTKVIIPVNLYGQCSNLKDIMDISREHNITVIEDNAQAIGSEFKLNGKWQKAGTVGHIGCTSFFPSKNLGCFGDGGAINTNNAELAEKIACITNHGSKVKYYTSMVGVNSRLDTIQAAILNVKLKYLDQYCASRQKAAAYYNAQLTGIEQIATPVQNSDSTHVFHQYTLKISKDRDELKSFLNNKGIPTMIYYPLGMHQQEAYKTTGDFEVSEELCRQVLSLPMHTELSIEQQEYICTTIKDFYR